MACADLLLMACTALSTVILRGAPQHSMHRKIDCGLGSSMRVACIFAGYDMHIAVLEQIVHTSAWCAEGCPCLPPHALPCPSDRSSSHPQTFPTVVQSNNLHVYSARSCMAVQPRHLAAHEAHTLCLVSELVVRHLEEARLTALLVLPNLHGSYS